MKKTLLSTVVVLTFGAAGAALAAEAPHWTYSGENGPTHWAELDPEYATCSTGRMQSPIDLASGGTKMPFPIALRYEPIPLSVLNNGHTIQIAAEGAGALQSADTPYELVQVHFHAPSEHVIGGRPVPVEAHFVHATEDGSLAVLGVLVVEGAENAALASLLARAPATQTPAKTFADVTFDLNGLLPDDTSVYRYNGSLTTPPCTEGVAWHVLEEPITASRAQIEQLSHLLHGNARPVQPLNGRPLILPSS